MQRLGYRGVMYVISGEVGQKGYANIDELKGMTEAGWEIGSHTDNHVNLRRLASGIEAEVLDSRTTLETQLGAPVVTFSFPFGLTNQYATRWVMDAGYQSAVGVGGLMRHTSRTQYYLSRIEVEGEFDIVQFSDLLPWRGVIRPWEIQEFMEQ
jgi:peptidoglycan/xylan/chitin deacetylase (PgdA/CDA1 family)